MGEVLGRGDLQSMSGGDRDDSHGRDHEGALPPAPSGRVVVVVNGSSMEAAIIPGNCNKTSGGGWSEQTGGGR